MAAQSNGTTAWHALATHYGRIKDVHLRRLFADDPECGERLTARRRTLSRLFEKPRRRDSAAAVGACGRTRRDRTTRRHVQGQEDQCDQAAQTGRIVWGEPGTDGQLSFYQLLHQATKLAPCEFIGFCRPPSPLADQHNLPMENLFAQAEALAFGKTAQELTREGSPAFQTPFRMTEGNSASNVILADALTPQGLGALTAMYEHSAFTQGAIWSIDSFDQEGVELGKVLAQRIIPELATSATPELWHDSSTNALIRRFRERRS